MEITFFGHFVEFLIDVGSSANSAFHHLDHHFRRGLYVHVSRSFIGSDELIVVEAIIFGQPVLIIFSELDSISCLVSLCQFGHLVCVNLYRLILLLLKNGCLPLVNVVYFLHQILILEVVLIIYIPFI